MHSTKTCLRELQSKLLILLCCGILTSCLTIGTRENLNCVDNLFGMTDPIHTSYEYPTARYEYTPTNHELQYISNIKFITRLENNYFLARTTFNTQTDTIKQRADNDCWTACALMLLRHENIRLPISEIDKRRDELSNASDAKDNLSIYLKLLNSYKNAAYTKPVTGTMLHISLANNEPLLVDFQYPNTATGHIEVVIGCYYSYMKPTGMDLLIKRDIEMAVDKIILVDPADGLEKIMPADEFVNKASFAISYMPEVQHIEIIGSH